VPVGDAHRAERRRLAAFAAVVVGLFVAATASGNLPSAGDVRDWGDGLGVAGPLVCVPAGAAMLCLFVPGPVVAGAAGLLFGTAGGTAVALAAIVLGAVTQMSISRRLAGDAAAHLLPARVRRFDDFIARRGFWAVFYMRLTPGIPYNLVNYGAGLTSLKVGAMAAGTAVGGAPRAFAWAALGGSLDDLGAPEAKVAIALLVTMALAGAFLARRQLGGARVLVLRARAVHGAPRRLDRRARPAAQDRARLVPRVWLDRPLPARRERLRARGLPVAAARRDGVAGRPARIVDRVRRARPPHTLTRACSRSTCRTS
jgi:uncharacterized membrane protein YdjX (TVP38/TMEM64 family)